MGIQSIFWHGACGPDPSSTLVPGIGDQCKQREKTRPIKPTMAYNIHKYIYIYVYTLVGGFNPSKKNTVLVHVPHYPRLCRSLINQIVLPTVTADHQGYVCTFVQKNGDAQFVALLMEKMVIDPWLVGYTISRQTQIRKDKIGRGITIKLWTEI